MNLIIPDHYDPVLDVRTTQEAIKYIRDTFQHELCLLYTSPSPRDRG